VEQLIGPTRTHGQPGGFTLVEIMIVVTILAIAAALAVPMIGDTSSTKLRGAASMLVADLSFAQVESIAHGDDTRLIVFDNPNDTYHIAAASDNTTPITNPINGQPYLISYGSGSTNSLVGVTIDSYTLDGDDELGYGVYGSLDQTTDATITLGCDGRSVTLTVDAETGESVIGAIN
jgi:prepilin-type N-terminal cleavage/methylation domain-containing protein